MYYLFAAASAEAEFRSAFSAFAAAKKKHKNGEQTSASADLIDYSVKATVFAEANYEDDYKHPKAPVIADSRAIQHFMYFLL